MSERTKIIKNKIPNLKIQDLEDIRVDLGLTIVEMAGLLEMSETSYHRLKRSSSNLDRRTSVTAIYLKQHFSPEGIKAIYKKAAKERLLSQED